MLSVKRKKLGFAVFVFALFAVFCSLQLKAPAIEDEVLHHRCKIIWFDKGADWCELAHTPLYHEATSLWQSVVGRASETNPDSIWIFRSFGMLTSALTLLIFFLATRRYSYSVILFAVLALHPYFVQFTTHLDYDSTVLVPPLLLATVLIERWLARAKPSGKLTAAIGLTLGFSIFAKELTPLIIIALWPAWALARKDRRFFAHALLGAALSLLTAYLILKAWGALRGFNWYDPLLLTKAKFFGRAGDGSFFPWRTWGWQRFLFLTYIPYLWIGFPFAYVFCLVLWRKGAKLKDIPFSIVAAAGIFAAYTWLVQAGFYFPKYTQPAFPILMYGLALMLSKSKIPATFHLSPPAVKAMIVIFFLGLLSGLDPIMIVEMRSQLNARTLLDHAVAILLPLTVLHFIKDRIPLTVLFLALSSYYLGTDVSHLFRKHSTKYLYGEHGFLETEAHIRKLKAEVSPNAPVLTTLRDLQWRFGETSGLSKFIEPTYFSETKQEAVEALAKTKILVARSYGSSAIRTYPQIKDLVDKSFPCHGFVDAPGQRFEWWWKPTGSTCDTN